MTIPLKIIIFSASKLPRKLKKTCFFAVLKVPKFGHLKILLSRAEFFSGTSRFRGSTRLTVLYHRYSLDFFVDFSLIFRDFFVKMPQPKISWEGEGAGYGYRVTDTKP